MRQEIEELPDISTLPPEKQSQQSDLPSEKDVDYTRLRDLLAAGKWKEADEETLAVMLKASGREKDGWLDIESIKNFPCTDLRTIDQLWVKYSNGRFGFSVQKRIWESVGGKPGADYEIWEKFGDRVGWRRRRRIKAMLQKEWLATDELNFTTQAREGHLPARFRVMGRQSALRLLRHEGNGNTLSRRTRRRNATNLLIDPKDYLYTDYYIDFLFFSSLTSRLAKCNI
ncbi:MAG: GUN4 domain-containing protein [Scytonema sp. RU_4_4]|nr:GUN4 domain-containing protein [Scytonema sp. RU_4_4]NJR74179.1 GUN4 domain-containing protein [Scytonema sp. CRU_2_7]